MQASSTDRIEKQIELKAPISRVWRALTDYKEFNTWFKVNLESPFAVGQTTRGQITYPGCEHMVMEVLVQKMEPERLFSYTWNPFDQSEPGANEPATLVEFELEEIEGGTLLRMTESGFDKISDKYREEAFRRNEGGWSEQMKNIDNHVTNNP